MALLLAIVTAQLPAAQPALAAPLGPPPPRVRPAPVAVVAPAPVAAPVAAPTAPPQVAAPQPVIAQEETPAPTGPAPTPTAPAPTRPPATIPPAPSPSPATTPTPIPATQFVRIVNVGAAALRTGPSTGAQTLIKIPHGQIVGKYAVLTGGKWYRASYRGKLGYLQVKRTEPVTLVGASLATEYPRVIVVARRQQHMEVWDRGRLMIITAVTTGRPELPTPLGMTKVQRRESPHLFLSPWHWPSPFWYPPGWADYTVLFRTGGFYFHDTRARPANGYGIGSNVPHTDPDGAERTGSRGCVNTPLWAVRMLYGWAQIGDRVAIVDA